MHPKYIDFLQQSNPIVKLIYDLGTPETEVQQHMHKQYTYKFPTAQALEGNILPTSANLN
jgi:hypothetical protein